MGVLDNINGEIRNSGLKDICYPIVRLFLIEFDSVFELMENFAKISIRDPLGT